MRACACVVASRHALYGSLPPRQTERCVSSSPWPRQKEKVCIVGSGNWGSAIAKIVGRNVLDRDQFDDEVTMWVFQESVDGKNLTDIINTEHENVKYLPVRPPA